MIMTDDADVPPLEDMSETFSNCLKIREEKKSKVQYKRNEVLEIPDDSEKFRAQQIEKLLGKETIEDKEIDKQEEDKKKVVKKADNFCGFKKGFLTAAPKNAVKKTDGNKTVIKKKEVVDKNVLPEVQNAMNQQMPFLKSNDWVTEDLLTKIAANPRLLKRFMDPRFSKIIEQFQTNPQQVMEMCENNPEIKEFIQDFCAIMGDHFTNLGEKQEEEKRQPTTSKKQPEENEDDKKMKKILSNPEIASILKTPDIQRLLQALKEEPHKAQKLLQSSDASMRLKIQKLVDVGLLQMAV